MATQAESSISQEAPRKRSSAELAAFDSTSTAINRAAALTAFITTMAEAVANSGKGDALVFTPSEFFGTMLALSDLLSDAQAGLRAIDARVAL
jgi:hypothetical protein